MVERGRRRPASTAAGAAPGRRKVFRNKATGAEQMALVKGTVDPDQPTLVRMHSLDLFADVFGEASERAAACSKARWR